MLKHHIIPLTLGSMSSGETGVNISVLCFSHQNGAAQKSIIIRGRRHNSKHKAGGYPAARLAFHCGWQSRDHVQRTNSKWHKIALYWQYWIPKGTAAASNYISLSLTVWNNIILLNGNVRTDIFTLQGEPMRRWWAARKKAPQPESLGELMRRWNM